MRMLSDSPGAAEDASSAPPPLLIAPALSAAPGVLPQPPAAWSDDASLDADMVIILAAMLCILLCAIGLNSLVICFRRRRHSSGHSGGRTLAVAAPSQSAAAMATTVPGTDDAGGLKKMDQLTIQIPVVLYEADGGVLSATEECAICLGDFHDGEKVRVLPRCNHGFHVECIDMWLPTHPSCPTCRNSLLLHDFGDRASEATSTMAGA